MVYDLNIRENVDMIFLSKRMALNKAKCPKWVAIPNVNIFPGNK